MKPLYSDITEFNNIQKNTKKQFSLMHLNISSLQYCFDELSDLLNKSNIKFSVIGISGSGIKKCHPPLSNINLKNDKIEHIPTESERDGSLLYISTQLNYKVCIDLKMYKTKELESICIGIMNKGLKDLIANSCRKDFI